MSAACGFRVVELCSGGTLIHRLERKGKSRVGDWVPMHACVLGLSCKGKKLDSNHPLLTVSDYLTLLPHRVTSVT